MKKKLLALIFAALMITVLSISVSATVGGTTCMGLVPGDVDADSEINTKDAVLLAQYLAGWKVTLGGDSHNEVIDEAVEATCKETGLTEGKHCSDCGTVLIRQENVPTKPHDCDKMVVQPTTSSEGYTLYECKNCDYEKKKDIIPPVNSNGLGVEVNAEEKTCIITGIGDCKDTDINIPEKISEYTVVGIADRAFEGQTQITFITIPDTVKTLGDRAFYGCNNLSNVKIPYGVTGIGNYTFYECSSLTSITIPDNVTSIGGYAFLGCNRLNSVIIPDSVRTISYAAFNGCPMDFIYYCGDESGWTNVVIASENGIFSYNTYYHSLNQPTVTGNYWRYVDGVPTPW